MLKKFSLATALALFFVFAAFPAMAQEALEFDTPVTGEITDAAFANEYTFEGIASQVVIIELIPVDILADLDNPSIILRDPAGTDLARYDGFGSTSLIWQLPEDGTYTVVATRQDDATGTSVGEYTLSVRAAQEIALDTPLESEINSETNAYYVINVAESFTLSFERVGDFDPEFSLNTIDTDITPGSLDTVAVVGGSVITKGTVGDIPGGTTYILRVGAPLFGFYFDEVSATYTITLAAAE